MAVLVAVLVSAGLLAAAFAGLRYLAVARRRRDVPQAAARGERSCPLCHSVLGPGQRVQSSLFPGKADRIMHIFGCPNCWPARISAPRICPVCGRELGPDGWVVARYFERPSARTSSARTSSGRSPGLPGDSGAAARRHVHVLGCTGCRR